MLNGHECSTHVPQTEPEQNNFAKQRAVFLNCFPSSSNGHVAGCWRCLTTSTSDSIISWTRSGRYYYFYQDLEPTRSVIPKLVLSASRPHHHCGTKAGHLGTLVSPCGTNAGYGGTQQYRVFKIETVGEVYVASSGLPLACADHAGIGHSRHASDAVCGAEIAYGAASLRACYAMCGTEPARMVWYQLGTELARTVWYQPMRCAVLSERVWFCTSALCTRGLCYGGRYQRLPRPGSAYALASDGKPLELKLGMHSGTNRYLLRACCAMSGTDLACGATSLPASYAMSGIDLAYGTPALHNLQY
eukprot:627376-Rhodomonas_salina.7